MSIYGHLLESSNKENNEYLDEGVIGAVAGIIIAPYVFIALIALIFNLAFKIKKLKYDSIINNNPETTKAIKNFALKCQDQIKKSMTGKYDKYFSPKPIFVSGKNCNKENIKICLGNFDHKLHPSDLYTAVAPYIYDEMDADERIERFGEDCDRDSAISDIESDANYFECEYDDFLSGGAREVEDILKKQYPELINAINQINKAVNALNSFIKNKTNSNGIYIAFDNNKELTLRDILENHCCEYVSINLIIKYQDYSKIELPEDSQKEIEKLN